MKHIIFSVIIMTLFSSCESWSNREINNHYIINLTNKKIVHILHGNDPFIKQDSFEFYLNNKCDTTFEWSVSAITGTTNDHGYISYDSFEVYNISDTTSICWKDIWGGSEYNKEGIPEIFNHSNGKEESDYKERESIWLINYYLTINDTLLSLMTKDYSMLERFKEYYQK